MQKKHCFTWALFAVVGVSLCPLLSWAQEKDEGMVSFDNEPETAFERAQKNFLRHKNEGIGFCLNDDTFLLSDGKHPTSMVIDFIYVITPNRAGNANERKVLLENVEYRDSIDNRINSSHSRIGLSFFKGGTLESYVERKGCPPGIYSFCVFFFENGKRERFVNWNYIEEYTRIIEWNSDGELLSDVRED